MRLADLIAPELRTRFPDHSLDFGARQLLSTDLGELTQAEQAALSQAVSSRLPNMTIAAQSGMKSSHGQTMSDRDAYARQPLPMRLMEQAGAGGLATLPSFSEKVNRTPHTPEPTNSAERIARGVGSGLVFGLEAVPIALTGGALGLPALATGAAAAGIPAALQAGTKKQRAIRGGVMAATGGTMGAVARGAGAVAGPMAEKATHMVGGPVAFGAAAPWAEYGVSKVLGEKDLVAPTARDIAEGMVGLGILGAASSVGARGTSKPGPATPRKEAARLRTEPGKGPRDASPSSDLLELGKGLDDTRSIPFAGKRTAAALYKERIASISPEATPEQARQIAARARREAQSVQEVDDALRPPKTTSSPDLLAAGRRIQERADQEMVGKRVAVETEKGPAFAEVAAVRVYPYPDVEMKARLILKDPQTGELFVQRYTDVAEMSKALSDPSSVDWASQGLGEGVKSEMGAATPGSAEMPQAVKGGVLASELEAGPAGALGGGSVKPGQLTIDLAGMGGAMSANLRDAIVKAAETGRHLAVGSDVTKWPPAERAAREAYLSGVRDKAELIRIAEEAHTRAYGAKVAEPGQLGSGRVGSKGAAEAEAGGGGQLAKAEAAPLETARLPRDLSGAKPRYGYGSKQFQLEFASDIDRAAFITSQKNKSARDADYRSFLRAQGFTDSQINARGQQVRQTLKEAARVGDPEHGPLRIASHASEKAAVGRATASGAGGAAVSLGPGPAPAASAGPGQTAASAAPTRFVAAHKLGERLYTAGNHGISYDKMLSDLSKTRPYPNPRNAEEIANNSADIEARATPAIEGFVDKATGEFYTRDQIESQYGTRWANDPNRPLNDWAGGAAVSPEPRPAPAAKSRPIRPVMEKFESQRKILADAEETIFDRIGLGSAETVKQGVHDLGNVYHYLLTAGRPALERTAPGKSLGDGIWRVLEESQDRGGIDAAEYARVGKGITPAQREAVGKIMGGEAPAEGPLAAKAAELRRVTDDVISEAQAVGLREKTVEGKLVPVRRMEQWFQQRVKESLRKKLVQEGTAENQTQIEWMLKQDPTVTAKQAQAALREYMDMPAEARVALQYERAMTIAPSLREWDFLKVLPDYSLKSRRRIAEAREFGARDEKATDLIYAIRDAGGDAPAAATIYRGLLNPSPKGRGFAFDRMLGTIHGVTVLSTAGIVQPSQMTNTAARIGFLNAFRGYAEILNGIVAGRLEVTGRIEPTEAARRTAGLKWAERTGAALTETVQDIVARESRSLLGRHVRLIGLEPLDRINRLATAYGTRLWAQDLAAKLARDPANEAVKRDLRRVGIDPAKVIESKGEIADTELRRIARQISSETQFESSVLDLPAFGKNTALGRNISRFRNFAFQQGRFVKQLTKEARQGNPAPLVRYLVGLSTVNASLGELVSFIRKRKRPDNLFWRWVEDMTLMGGIGLLGDALRAASSGKEQIAALIGGITFSETVRLTSGAVKTAKGDPRQLLRHIISRAWLLGPYVADWLVPKKKAA